LVGNDAAHPDKQPVIEKDAQDILNLTEQFLYVIYVAPAIAKEQRTKRGKSQSFSSPLMGEGRVGVAKFPLPSIPSHQGRGRKKQTI
jgi:hypothetical protein